MRHHIHRQCVLPLIPTRIFSLLSLVLMSFGMVMLSSCGKDHSVKKVGYLLLLEDETLQEARRGFIASLKDGGFEDGKNLTVLYRNAQGDLTAQVQILDYFIDEGVDLIATNPTVSTIAAVQRTTDKLIPICMMVSPRPDLAKLTDSQGNPPKHLTGTYETLAYIDTSVALIKHLFPQAKKIGTLYNSSEPNSVNGLDRLRQISEGLGLELVSRAVTNSNETQQAALALLSEQLDVFFALPDNIIFSSFETIDGVMTDAGIPIVSSEAGLVSRGALAAYGADMYQWGYQAGKSAVTVLKTGTVPAPDEVTDRKRIYNLKTAAKLKLIMPNTFEPLNQSP